MVKSFCYALLNGMELCEKGVWLGNNQMYILWFSSITYNIKQTNKVTSQIIGKLA